MATKNTVGVRVLDYPSFRRKLEELKKAQQVAAVARGKSRKKNLWFADKEAKVRCLKTKQQSWWTKAQEKSRTLPIGGRR